MRQGFFGWGLGSRGLRRRDVETPRPTPILRFVLPTLRTWRDRYRSRRRLRQLDDRELADVGLSRAQQRQECCKRFWQE
ncbi:MAG: DUF1127 domain-containing protein [Proteobacteria bacterium]|nr:DUF1127 domain-containing protein [Pseudomonadota bacterium]